MCRVVWPTPVRVRPGLSDTRSMERGAVGSSVATDPYHCLRSQRSTWFPACAAQRPHLQPTVPRCSRAERSDSPAHRAVPGSLAPLAEQRVSASADDTASGPSARHSHRRTCVSIHPPRLSRSPGGSSRTLARAAPGSTGSSWRRVPRHELCPGHFDHPGGSPARSSRSAVRCHRAAAHQRLSPHAPHDDPVSIAMHGTLAPLPPTSYGT